MGEGGVGVDKIKTLWSPLPFIPSHQSLRLETEGRGDFRGELKKC
jgi:hypothetical protein